MVLPEGLRPVDLVCTHAYQDLQKRAELQVCRRELLGFKTRDCARKRREFFSIVSSFEDLFHTIILDEICEPDTIKVALTPLGRKVILRFINFLRHFFAICRIREQMLAGKLKGNSLPPADALVYHAYTMSCDQLRLLERHKASSVVYDYANGPIYIPHFGPSIKRRALWGLLYLQMRILEDSGRRFGARKRARLRAGEYFAELLVTIKLNLNYIAQLRTRSRLSGKF